MTKETFHIIWTTYETPKPENQNGDWTDLLEVYDQIKERGADIYMPLLIASKNNNNKQMEKQVLLSSQEVEKTIDYLNRLTQKNGDNIAGGNNIVVQEISCEKVELLIECRRDKLQQVVGRLKSKSAGALLWDRPEEKHMWSKGFWYTQLLDVISKQWILNYIKRKNTA